jgi:hypothetical protein
VDKRERDVRPYQLDYATTLDDVRLPSSNDGYWNDGSDYNLYLDDRGRLRLTPHDVNEGFRARGAAGASVPDPLAALEDPNKAMRRALLGVPSLRDRYLRYVGDIAEKWLDWNRLGPLIERYRSLISEEVGKDTRKHDGADAFAWGIDGAPGSAPPATSLRGFADQRRAFLLAHPEVARVRPRVYPGPLEGSRPAWSFEIGRGLVVRGRRRTFQ